MAEKQDESSRQQSPTVNVNVGSQDGAAYSRERNNKTGNGGGICCQMLWLIKSGLLSLLLLIKYCQQLVFLYGFKDEREECSSISSEIYFNLSG